jgi:hypothetical protein
VNAREGVATQCDAASFMQAKLLQHLVPATGNCRAVSTCCRQRLSHRAPAWHDAIRRRCRRSPTRPWLRRGQQRTALPRSLSWCWDGLDARPTRYKARPGRHSATSAHSPPAHSCLEKSGLWRSPQAQRPDFNAHLGSLRCRFSIESSKELLLDHVMI